MTIFEAIDKVEKAMTAFDTGLTCDKRPLLPAQVAGLVSEHYGKEWSDLEDGFESGAITPEQYASRAIEMVEGFHKHRQRVKVEKKLLALKEK